MSIISYRPADGKYRHGHSVYVLLFKQVDRLEQIDVRDAVFNASLLKPTKHFSKKISQMYVENHLVSGIIILYVLAYIVHHLIIAARSVDFSHTEFNKNKFFKQIFDCIRIKSTMIQHILCYIQVCGVINSHTYQKLLNHIFNGYQKLTEIQVLFRKRNHINQCLASITLPQIVNDKSTSDKPTTFSPLPMTMKRYSDDVMVFLKDFIRSDECNQEHYSIILQPNSIIPQNLAIIVIATDESCIRVCLIAELLVCGIGILLSDKLLNLLILLPLLPLGSKRSDECIKKNYHIHFAALSKDVKSFFALLYQDKIKV
ncbi:hypothetical protein AGLY_009956 [Aphis glycines]|uniref:Uncharacterized protein n=1 Tax=Aphis glycines TaxID=307491 RepID=A0A6G0TGF0_APHGL|nr:hypothetical protein AGLY_009956 [Aphis glycines]